MLAAPSRQMPYIRANRHRHSEPFARAYTRYFVTFFLPAIGTALPLRVRALV
jgi:hypothetical protein